MKAFVVTVFLFASAICNANESLNYTEWNNAKSILSGARDILIKNGWYRVEPKPNAADCLATALEKSWKKSGLSLVDFSYARLALDKAIDAPKDIPTAEDDPLSVPYWGRYYMYWSDAENRTEQQVMTALDRAISFATYEQQVALSAKLAGNSLSEFDERMMRRFGFLK